MVKPYLRKVKGKKRRKRVRGHYITVFINDYSSNHNKTNKEVKNEINK